jgi:hypothetical protein
MPRKPQVTLDLLQFKWRADGTTETPRHQPSLRPMAYEIGRLLLALAEADTPLTIADLAQRTDIDECLVRSGMRDLLETGCLTRARQPRRRAQDIPSRWGHGYELGPEREVRGLGRRPRLVQLALLIEEDLSCGDYVDVLLRDAGILSAQVVHPGEAHRLLARLGFDLVVADAASCLPSPGPQRLAAAVRSAGCISSLLLGSRKDAFPELARTFDAHTTLHKPFTPQLFAQTLAHLGLGTSTYQQLSRYSAS